MNDPAIAAMAGDRSARAENLENGVRYFTESFA